MNKTVPNPELKAASRSGYCIFVDCVCGGMTPVWRDEAGKWVVFETKAEAQAEILDDFLERQRQFFNGERDVAREREDGALIGVPRRGD